MKKYIFSVLMAAMAAFTFISCEDVPEPYTLPTQPGAPTTPEVATQGTEASPYTVTDAKTVKTGTGKYIKGYIVGYVPDKALNEAIFGDASSAETAPTNILLAAKADEKEVNNCMPIQLPAGDLRTALNLKDNPGNLKKELIICGNIETYFGATGLKSATYAKINGKEIGKKPGDTTPGTDLKGEAKGDGSEANPFNSVAAQKYTAALEAGKATDKEFYIKGKVQSIKEQFSTPYGNGSFYIADDANSTQFYIFRIYYFGGEKWKEGDMTLKEGDEIVVCAKLINYMGNTPETNQGGKLISVNGKTSAGGGEVKPDPDPKPDPTPGEVATGENGGFETWADGKPTNWKTASTAGNATLSQSEDAHSGKYSVKVGGSASANKRLGYKEITLKAGEYKVKFYAKAVTEKGASVRPGIVPVTDGKAGDYIYGEYVNELKNTEWKLVEQTLTISADGTYCFVIMNAKKPGGDVLIDDFTVTFGSTAIIK
ncbi:DUF6359 domain-containing protein [Segatella copri]|uniref:DUF6359 domain-containing protein n=1 Tax=Segatella copri TaxID=165179 RepID=UPI0012913AE8|nr:DUF6359 domain-containing protein [Segatella copri]MQM47411.1 hypothetical protein [Segatella copri]MQM48604.1 hypothetical protein [Segatella copri]MQM69271.1 hypothetical protein [Segatella copri]MQM76521.1 hypothetical protein [Segatella copri]MQM84849.1 hypothetical protein [Segatella copri]